MTPPQEGCRGSGLDRSEAGGADTWPDRATPILSGRNIAGPGGSVAVTHSPRRNEAIVAARKGSTKMKRLKISIATGACILALTGSQAFATDPHSGGSTGRPSQSCQALGLTTPGNSASSPGSPFNEPGTMGPGSPGGNAGTHYAGNGPTNSANGQASQYDVACFQQSSHQMP
jgi:hypothetical protein